MTFAPVVAAVGYVDRERIAGSGGVDTAWRDLDTAAPGDGRTFRAVFGRSDETFRRLDVVSRVLVLACEAAGLDRLLPVAHRERTALVVATTQGCLDADRQFAQSLGSEMLDAPIFPYTLPSTCLGEVALRHGLRGASICLSVAPAGGGSALAEAVRLLAGGETDTAVAAVVDVSRRDPRCCEATVALLGHPRLLLPAVAPWPDDGTPSFDTLRAAIGHA